MKRRNYIVQFFYETDLRTEARVSAYNEISALAMALEDVNEEKWVNEEGFRIVINATE